MKIAILNDTHLGVRNASDVFLNYTESFFKESFFPYCEKNGIRHILHGGDFFDNRRFLSVKVLARTKEMFLSELTKRGIQMDIVLGNHDVYYKNSNHLHSLTATLADHPNITIHSDPIDWLTPDAAFTIALIPWINDENRRSIFDFIRSSKSPIALGHLELQGFTMMQGNPTTSHGDSPELFSKFEAVYSGHYHTKSSRGNIHYLGTQYELTWSDCEDPKAFHVLDTETRDVIAVPFRKNLFHKIHYHDLSRVEISRMDFSNIAGCFVRIIVSSKKNSANFDAFYDRIMKAEPHDVRIVETTDFDLSGTDISEDINMLTLDTSVLIHKYIDNLETELNKDILKTLVSEIYTEAQNNDTV